MRNCTFLFPKILIGEFVLKKIKNIRIVGIAPGYTKTPMLEKMNQDILEKLIKDVHLNRLIEPDEIALLIEHIMVNEAINGTTIEITGGLCHQSGVVKESHVRKNRLAAQQNRGIFRCYYLVTWVRCSGERFSVSSK